MPCARENQLFDVPVLRVLYEHQLLKNTQKTCVGVHLIYEDLRDL